MNGKKKEMNMCFHILKWNRLLIKKKKSGIDFSINEENPLPVQVATHVIMP